GVDDDGVPHRAGERAAEHGARRLAAAPDGVDQPRQLPVEDLGGRLGCPVGGAHARPPGGEDHARPVRERGPQRVPDRLDAVGHRRDGEPQLGEQARRERAGDVLALPSAAPGGDGEDRRGHVVAHSARLVDGSRSDAPTEVPCHAREVYDGQSMRGGPVSLADAPQWLVSAFVRSAVAVGACADREEIKRTASALVERWQEPDRKFHNLRHLIDVLARVEELAEEAHVPDVVRLAAWYHGAVFSSSAQVAYTRLGGEDEVASAALARTELTALGVPEDVVERVAELILALARHDADERDVDALALCDADLGTLAVEPQRYTAYRKAIREEYAHIPEEDYVAS